MRELAHSQDNNENVSKVSLGIFFSLEEFCQVCSGERWIELAPDVWHNVKQSHQRMQTCINENRIVYGITTGFGPLANRIIDNKHIQDLQKNLIYHLASGVGELMSWEAGRAVMLDRLVSITRGWSGASVELVNLLVDCLNLGIAPAIPEKGTVGASGDLTPSAHMALALMGEGAFLTQDGHQHPSGQLLELLDLKPFSLSDRDGLALVNGTSAMTGIAALTQRYAQRAIDWSVKLSVCHAELLDGFSEAWHPAFAEARPHLGQSAITAKLNTLILSSSLIQTQRLSQQFLGHYNNNSDQEYKNETTTCDEIYEAPLPPQDPYTIRCAPQVLGAIQDMLDFHERLVETEMNSTTDNPLFETQAPYALHGGNFYGQHVAFASDSLKMALIKLAVFSERQIARLTDEKMNKGLPAFLQPNSTGLHSGFMGAQVTASALVAELRTQAVPASIQSIPTNGNNQDVVSMGTIAARSTHSILQDVFRVLAIQALAVSQAIDLLIKGAAPNRRQYQLDEFSTTAQDLHMWVRTFADFLDNDRPLSKDIESLAQEMCTYSN